jgi:hypothetical protein
MKNYDSLTESRMLSALLVVRFELEVARERKYESQPGVAAMVSSK